MARSGWRKIMRKNIKKQSGKIGWSLLFALIVIGIVTLFFGMRTSLSAKQAQASAEVSYANQLKSAIVLPEPRTLNAFTLTDLNNQTYTNKNLKNHWTLFFFGFTSCPYICPTTMAELTKVYNLLQKNKVPEPQVVLVSIDPQTDTVEKIKTFVTAYNKNFIGVRTDDENELNELTKEFGVVYMKTVKNVPDKEGNKFEIDHSGAIMLINPEGKLMAFFSMPHKAENIAEDFMTIQKNFRDNQNVG